MRWPDHHKFNNVSEIKVHYVKRGHGNKIKLRNEKYIYKIKKFKYHA